MPFSPAFDPARQRQIRRLSLLVRVLCLLAGVSLLVLVPALWSEPNWVVGMAKREFGFKLVQLDAAARWGGMAAMMLPTATSLWALFETWRLFGCYAQGDLLSLRPALHLRRLSLAVISYAPAVTAGQTLTALALTWANPPGQRMLWLGLSSQHYVALLIGLVLLAVSTVLLEAARVADENAEFV
jgi:hypothetical protein